VGGGFHVSAQANAYPDRPDIMDGVAHFYNEDEANLAAKAVNEHAALVAVAEAAERHQDSLPGEELKNWATLQKALAALAAVRAGSEVAK